MDDFFAGFCAAVLTGAVMLVLIDFVFDRGTSTVIDSCKLYGAYSNESEKIECSYAER
jgi:hypothetical protein